MTKAAIAGRPLFTGTLAIALENIDAAHDPAHWRLITQFYDSDIHSCLHFEAADVSLGQTWDITGLPPSTYALELSRPLEMVHKQDGMVIGDGRLPLRSHVGSTQTIRGTVQGGARTAVVHAGYRLCQLWHDHGYDPEGRILFRQWERR